MHAVEGPGSVPLESGFLLTDVVCERCGQHHDLFVGELISPHDRYLFTCPRTGERTTASTGKPSRIVASQPAGSLPAV
jgi:hypothetical protein